MNKALSKYWWVLGLRGLTAILFGILTIMWPGLTVLTLVFLFALYALFGGVVSIIGAALSRHVNADWWMPLLVGLVSIGAGIIAIAHPTLTALILVLVIAANALIIGILDIVSAIQMRKKMQNEKMMLFNGITSILFGVLVFLYPEAGGLAMIWIISLYAILTGIFLLAVAYRVHAFSNRDAPSVDRRISSDRRASSGYA